MEWISLVLGTILGTISGFLFPIGVEKINKYRKTRRILKRRLLLESDKIHEWICRYYESRGRSVDLFDCKIGNSEIKIPFITKKEWLFILPVKPEKDSLLIFHQSRGENFDINYKLIKKREYLGQILFNEPGIYIDSISEQPDKITLNIKSCQFFQIAKNMIELEEETFRAIKKWSFKRTPIRDKYLSSLEAIQHISLKPLPVGCAVTFAVRTPNSYEIIIHTKSHSTVTLGGTKAIIPNYGLVPFAVSNNVSQLGILFYNFIREYLEELFNYEEMVKLFELNKTHPTWFYDIPEAKQLINSKIFSCEVTGFGFNGLNGALSIAMLVMVDDVKFTDKLKRRINANWEVAKRTVELIPLEFIDYKSSILESWLLEKKFSPASAFSISRAVERLDSFMTAPPGGNIGG